MPVKLIHGVKMRSNVPIPKIRGRVLVRDREGRPKFDDPGKVKDYVNVLTKEDKDYLVNLFNVKRFEDLLDG